MSPRNHKTVTLCQNKKFSFLNEWYQESISDCHLCSKLKPQFHKVQGNLIHATQPFERLNIDFKGPLPSSSQNKYILTILMNVADFYLPFVVLIWIHLLLLNVWLSCFQYYIHSDRGPSLISTELKLYLNARGVATSRTSAYNPKGNGQVEWYKGIIQKTINLALKSNKLHVSQWESVITDSLHSIRSLLCTSTTSTPHERLFNYQCHLTSGNAVPNWLSTPETVLLRQRNRQGMYDPFV